jgi:hypothetical protein
MPTSNHQIVINSSHYDSSTNSFIYRFQKPQTFLTGDLIGVKSASIFHSFFNVEAPNNVIKIDFPSGANDWITLQHAVEPGFYDASSFSAYLQSVLYTNKMYSETEDGKFLSYIFIGESITQYANTITTYSINPSVVPPSGAAWSQLVGTSRSPKIYLGMIGPRFGFAADASLTTAYGYTEDASKVQNSVITPQINPFNSIILTCDCIFNVGLAYPSNFLFSMSLSTGFGGLIVSPSSQTIYNQIRPGQYDFISIRVCDSTVIPLQLRDTNISLVLSIIKQ